MASKDRSGTAPSRKRAEKEQWNWNLELGQFCSKAPHLVAKMGPKKPQGSQNTSKGRKGLSPVWIWRNQGLEGPMATDSWLSQGLGIETISEGFGSSTLGHHWPHPSSWLQDFRTWQPSIPGGDSWQVPGVRCLHPW